MERESITQRVFRLAAERDVKQVDIATACRLSPSTVCTWYKRDISLPCDVLMVICRLLEISPELALTGVDEHYPSQPVLPADEFALLDSYRACSDEGKMVLRASAVLEARRNERSAV